MTDEELKAAILDMKPKTDWVKLGAFALTAATTAWAASQYVGDTVKRPEVKLIIDQQTNMRIEQVISNGKIERLEQSSARIEKAVEEVRDLVREPRGKRPR